MNRFGCGTGSGRKALSGWQIYPWFHQDRNQIAGRIEKTAEYLRHYIPEGGLMVTV